MSIDSTLDQDRQDAIFRALSVDHRDALVPDVAPQLTILLDRELRGARLEDMPILIRAKLEDPKFAHYRRQQPAEAAGAPPAPGNPPSGPAAAPTDDPFERGIRAQLAARANAGPGLAGNFGNFGG